ncbi:hypothetical protein D9M68_888990 [compost metagenome]
MITGPGLPLVPAPLPKGPVTSRLTDKPDGTLPDISAVIWRVSVAVTAEVTFSQREELVAGKATAFPASVGAENTNEIFFEEALSRSISATKGNVKATKAVPVFCPFPSCIRSIPIMI